MTLPLFIVLDTNIVLDLLVFADAATTPVMRALSTGGLRWVATQPMRDELQRVLAYPQIVPRLAYYRLSATDVLAHFDRQVRLVDVPPKAPVTCKDADDQKFIDLAVAHRCPLLSKDRAVLALRKRLVALGVAAAPVLPDAYLSP